MRIRNVKVTVSILVMFMGIAVIFMNLKSGVSTTWADILVAVCILFIALAVAILEIRQLWVDKQTELYGEFCYARITEIAEEKARRGRECITVGMNIYMFESRMVIPFKETAYVDEVEACNVGDYIAIKYYNDDVNIEFKVVSPDVIRDDIRIALGEENFEKKEKDQEYLREKKDDLSMSVEDQRIIIDEEDEGFGYEIGNEKPLDLKQFKVIDDSRIIDLYNEEAKKKSKKTVVGIILWCAFVAIFIMLRIMS